MTGWDDGGEPEAGRLRWRSRGEGPTVVLLHKLGGWTAEWLPLAERLLGHRVLAMDLPGHGGGYGPPPYIQSTDDSADGVIATLDHLGVQTFALGGSSLGGAVAVILAANHPQRVKHLALISVALTGAATLDAMQASDARNSGRLYGTQDQPLPRPFAETAKAFGWTDAALHEDMERSRAAAGPWVRASWRGANLADVRGALPRVPCPSLLIYGERGGGYETHEATGLADLPNAQSLRIADSGAFTYEDQPAATAAALGAFFAS